MTTADVCSEAPVEGCRMSRLPSPVHPRLEWVAVLTEYEGPLSGIVRRGDEHMFAEWTGQLDMGTNCDCRFFSVYRLPAASTFKLTEVAMGGTFESDPMRLILPTSSACAYRLFTLSARLHGMDCSEAPVSRFFTPRAQGPRCLPRTDDAPQVLGLIDLARLALAFGRVNRATFHPDGVTPESDTDHTVMLALIAPALAASLRPDLRPDLVCAFAVVHDLVEVKTGDTNTIGITAEGRAAKAAREAAALVELRKELAAFPWIVGTLDRYEAQVEPEARWVRYIDKVLPKLTHAQNGCVAARSLARRLGEPLRHALARVHEAQRDELAQKYPEFPEADAVLRYAMDAAEAACPEFIDALDSA